MIRATSETNPKSEYRNSKQTQSQMNPNAEKIQNSNRKHLVWKFLIFEHLDLFRISDFEFRASAFFHGKLVGIVAFAVAFALCGAMADAQQTGLRVEFERALE
jgi:hypothetical protein